MYLDTSYPSHMAIENWVLQYIYSLAASLSIYPSLTSPHLSTLTCHWHFTFSSHAPSIVALSMQQILRQFSFKDILCTERHEEPASVTIKLRDTQFTFLLEDRLAYGELVHILDGCEEYHSWRVSPSLCSSLSTCY